MRRRKKKNVDQFYFWILNWIFEFWILKMLLKFLHVFSLKISFHWIEVTIKILKISRCLFVCLLLLLFFYHLSLISFINFLTTTEMMKEKQHYGLSTAFPHCSLQILDRKFLYENQEHLFFNSFIYLNFWLRIIRVLLIICIISRIIY